MGKWVMWMMLGAFLVSIPMLSVAQTTQGQEDQPMTADQQQPAAAVESQQTPAAAEGQPPTMVTPSQPEMEPAKPPPPLALERRMRQARTPRLAKATAACPARPACDRGTTRKMTKHHAARGHKKMATHRLAHRKMVKHRAASHVCLTRAKYHRLMAMARSHEKMAAHRLHRRVAMHRAHRRIARAGPTRSR